MNNVRLFGNFDIKSIKTNPDFKEDSVREVIILPILKELGYSQDNIIRSKTLQHPYLKIGSKKRPINLIPDYSLKVENNFAFVLDAKAPDQKIINDDNVEQVYSYASHPEIRSIYFSLCNGLEFSVFRTTDTGNPLLHFQVEDIEDNWDNLKLLLSPDSFQIGKSFSYDFAFPQNKAKSDFDYNKCTLPRGITVEKQKAKRHYGVHGYFTKQSWNVVRDYIKNFSKTGDLILDPFGGSGVTAVEALMNSRKAINIDLNPMAVFIVNSLIAPVNLTKFNQAFDFVKSNYIKLEPKTEIEIQKALKKYPQPRPIPLPKGSNVSTADELFTSKQKAQLGLLKHLILKQENLNIRNSLLLAFSSTVTKINRTYHNSSSRDENSGNAAAFAYYRYRIALEEIDLDVMNTFEIKIKKLLSAKKEMQFNIDENTISNAQIIKGTATNLDFIDSESVDYIYTDPPYGKKIPYLDLSAMWNAWLDLEVTEQDYQLEAIEGGEHNKSKEEYNNLISQSIKEMYRVLKFDRWLSFVFAHKDPEFWHLIIETAEKCGFEYIGAVPQKNGQTSFKKRQNPFTVLSGQLIINFRKVRKPRTILRANLGMDIEQIVMQTIEGIIAKNHGATLEQINDELIIKGLELGFLDLLKKEYTDLTPLLLENFDYNENTEKFSIKKNTKFRTYIDIRLRIRYYLLSYLRRMEREKVNPHFDDIILDILPLLKNGITPENQTILSVLEDIAVRVDKDSWQLKNDPQTELFQ
ncbi:MAG: type I restriction enzyme HsdR N-terminal domain-containing protein [Candidatus Kapabacteria bacterium]|nr:type I restriction enzyme HsdR N-terminal domain-containing protein [Ignavibacteriota bacterium]MCW5884207.1 type I restriction enzyme HsdR N-terminal domain-containing protein [Candidatus Kapabacteria bacterium]